MPHLVQRLAPQHVLAAGAGTAVGAAYGGPAEAIATAGLERHHCLAREQVDVAHFIEQEQRRRNSGLPSFPQTDPPDKFSITGFGEACLDYLTATKTP